MSEASVPGPLGEALHFELRDNQVITSFVGQQRHRGRPGYLHGGVAALLLDETMAALSWALDRRRCVTGTLELRYLAPIPLFTALRVESWRPGVSSRRACGHIVLPDGQVAVTGSGIFVPLSER